MSTCPVLFYSVIEKGIPIRHMWIGAVSNVCFLWFWLRAVGLLCCHVGLLMGHNSLFVHSRKTDRGERKSRGGWERERDVKSVSCRALIRTTLSVMSWRNRPHISLWLPWCWYWTPVFLLLCEACMCALGSLLEVQCFMSQISLNWGLQSQIDLTARLSFWN